MISGPNHTIVMEWNTENGTIAWIIDNKETHQFYHPKLKDKKYNFLPKIRLNGKVKINKIGTKKCQIEEFEEKIEALKEENNNLQQKLDDMMENIKIPALVCFHNVVQLFEIKKEMKDDKMKK